MLHRIPMRSRLAAVVAAAFVGVAALAWAAPADDLREAQKLYGQGKVQPALEKVDVFLRAQPKDPQGRFLRGILLTELKRTPEAIQAFTSLTEDFPELPEPYNNLAVLYASQGNYDKAKSALELAIHTHPSYATAHENLGDIYAQLASRAYDRALQLDKNNPTAQSKLAMIKELFSSTKAGGQRPEASRAAAIAKSEATRVEPPRPEPAKVAEAPKPAEAAKAPAKAAPPAATVTPAATPAPAAGNDDKARVTAAIEGWARAWSRKDVKGYLAAYAPEFDPPGSLSRAAWEKQRQERIEAPKSIEVDVKVQSVQVSGNEATAVIRQSYRSDTLKSNNTKTLKLVKSGDRWLIKQERVGG
jgi:Flp pilus assembly protein TadD/ketosteroid isomerase-like protein